MEAIAAYLSISEHPSIVHQSVGQMDIQCPRSFKGNLQTKTNPTNIPWIPPRPLLTPSRLSHLSQRAGVPENFFLKTSQTNFYNGRLMVFEERTAGFHHNHSDIYIYLYIYIYLRICISILVQPWNSLCKAA